MSGCPRRTVVHKHPIGESVVPEDGSKTLLDRLGLLIITSLDSQGKAGVVIQDCEGMAPSTPAYCKVPLEVHLPQLVWRLSLKALPGRVFGALAGIYAAVPFQDSRDSAGARHPFVPMRQQPRPKLASSPGRMPITDFQDRPLHLGRCPARRMMWPSGQVRQTRLTMKAVSPQPLVRCRSAYLEAPTQLPHIGSIGRHCQRHKLFLSDMIDTSFQGMTTSSA